MRTDAFDLHGFAPRGQVLREHRKDRGGAPLSGSRPVGHQVRRRAHIQPAAWRCVTSTRDMPGLLKAPGLREKKGPPPGSGRWRWWRAPRLTLHGRWGRPGKRRKNAQGRAWFRHRGGFFFTKCFSAFRSDGRLPRHHAQHAALGTVGQQPDRAVGARCARRGCARPDRLSSSSSPTTFSPSSTRRCSAWPASAPTNRLPFHSGKRSPV